MFNATANPITIQKGQNVGTWIGALEAAPSTNKPVTSAYSCFSFVDLEGSLLEQAPPKSPLRALLWKWRRCFSIDKFDVGRNGPAYRIKTLTGQPYKGYVPRRLPAAVAAIQAEVAKMKKADMIKESNSPYASPMVCVPKPNGQLRVCINFRMVNQDIVNDAYPMHRINEQLEAMAGLMVFTTLDLTKGYH